MGVADHEDPSPVLRCLDRLAALTLDACPVIAISLYSESNPGQTFTMENKSESQQSDAVMKMERWQRFIERTNLTFAAACSGVVLYLALYPGFYYMVNFAFCILLWGAVAVGCLFQLLAVQAFALWKRLPLPSSAARGLGFIFCVLLLTSLLVAFKVPLRASFLLAKPGLEEALEQHRDDLSKVGLVHHDYGIYEFRGAGRRCHHKDRVFFQFRNDGEAAIIYSESGIEDLCYNSGNKGHLMGNWYWMKED